MSEAYGPFSSGPGASFTETQWRELFGNLFTPGIINGAKVNGASGGNLAVTVSSGLTVNIATGAGIVYGFAYENDGNPQLTKTVGNRDTTADRYDRIVLRFGFSAKSVAVAVLAGTLGAGIPALTQNSTTWEVPLATIDVIHNANPTYALTSGDIHDTRVYSTVIGVAANLNADTVDGYHASSFLRTTETAADSSKLGGNSPGSGNGINVDMVDGIHGSAIIQNNGTVLRVIAVTSQPTNNTGNNGDIIVWYTP